jgi:glycerol-3-phosphate acyltransferase PlsX
MILALDVMGYENDISESIDAALVLIKKHKDLKIILVGDEAKIKTHKQHTKFEIVNSTQVVEMGEDITTTMRKKDSSMYKAIKLVADNQADGVLSAGSTASYVMLTRLLLKLIPGINKASFMCYFPTASKTLLALLDCGANLECSGEDLYQFAKMASIFKKHVEKNENPSISVVNIGTEKHKGYAYHQKADELLSADKSLNYQGFMETREYIYGPRDIAVADGYTGNLMLKAYEGTMKALSKVIKKSFI